jgi:hypothetical protein
MDEQTFRSLPREQQESVLSQLMDTQITAEEEKLKKLEERAQKFNFSYRWPKTTDFINFSALRSFLLLTGSGVSLYVGVKTLFSKDGNKLLGWTATVAGGSGACAMLYDLYYSHKTKK